MVYVAEGTYGCVYRPPIKCKNGTKYTKGKVSKLMTRRAAKKEVDEYEFIKKVDKKEIYYPGPPIECEIDPTDANREIIPGKCKLFDEDPNINNYKLLIYNDGGYDLSQFIKNHLGNYLATNKREQTDKFFLNALLLFQGVEHFLKNNLLHHDLKPQNIVFDPKTYRFNFIDFGLAEQKNRLVEDILKERDHENFHWSYPPEFGFLNYGKSYYIKRMDGKLLNQIKRDFKVLFNTAKPPEMNLYGIRPASFKTVLRYMENKEGRMLGDKFVDHMIDGLEKYVPATDAKYKILVKKLLEYTDIYALGFTMNHMLNSFYSKKALTKDEYMSYSRLFQQMCHPNVDIRTSFTMTEYKNWYEKILKDTGVFERTAKPKAPTVEAPAVEPKAEPIEPKAEPIEPKAEPIEPKAEPGPNACPDGKEINPDTGRCIKSCLPGQYRDAFTRRCRKIK